MKNLRNFLAPVCLAATTLSAAQSVFAPSSIDSMSPLSQPLAGTLFFDQKQRDQMDRVRKRGGIIVDQTTGEPVPSVLNGFVKRSDGISTVWVDGIYKTMSDATMMLRIQSTSVGMDAGTIVAGDTAGEAGPAEAVPSKTSGKKRAAARKPNPGVSPSRK